MNVGRLDQLVRILLGLLLVIPGAVGFFGSWSYIGLIPLITGLLRWCPLYSILGVQTCFIHEQVYKKGQ